MNGAAVHCYSMKKNGNIYLSKNFRVREFRCQDGSDPVFISSRLVEVLQDIRDHFGKPVTITSAYRTAQHNKAVGSETNSQHLYGLAADIIVEGIGPTAVAAYAEKLMPNTGGIGVYEKQGFVHIDVRKVKSRWKSN